LIYQIIPPGNILSLGGVFVPISTKYQMDISKVTC
jgi:hypothetical protein